MYNALGDSTVVCVGDKPLKCPVTGAVLSTAPGSAHVDTLYRPRKQSLQRSRSLWLRKESDLIISNIRCTNYMNSNTNEKRSPNDSGATFNTRR